MTDHRVSDLSYGHLGTAIYDLDEERWLFNRRPGRRNVLQRIGPIIESVQASSHESRIGYHESTNPRGVKSSGLMKAYPDLVPALPLLHTSAFTSPDSQHPTTVYDPSLSTRFDFGKAQLDQLDGSRNIDVLAVATGEAGDSVKLLRVHNRQRRWEYTGTEGLVVPEVTDVSHAVWRGNGAPILQICFAQIDGVGPNWLAVRQATSTTIFRPRYHRHTAVPSPGPGVRRSRTSRLNINPFTTISISQTGGFTHADVDFNPSDPSRIALVDQSGQWSVWDFKKSAGHSSSFALVPGHRGWISEVKHDPSVPSVPSIESDGWGRVVWTGSAHGLFVCNRRHIAIIDQGSTKTCKRLNVPDLGIQSTSAWILDVKRSPVSSSHVFILTSHQLFWLDIGTPAPTLPGFEFETATEARILLSWRHFRSSGDPSMQITVSSTRESSIILLWSELNHLVTVYEFAVPADASIPTSKSDPFRLIIPEGVLIDANDAIDSSATTRRAISGLSLARLEGIRTHGSYDADADADEDEGRLRTGPYFQLFILCQDLSVSACFYTSNHAGVDHASRFAFPTIVRNQRDQQPKSSRRISKDTFIVEDGLESDSDQDTLGSQRIESGVLMRTRNRPPTLQMGWLYKVAFDIPDSVCAETDIIRKLLHKKREIDDTTESYREAMSQKLDDKIKTAYEPRQTLHHLLSEYNYPNDLESVATSLRQFMESVSEIASHQGRGLVPILSWLASSPELGISQPTDESNKIAGAIVPSMLQLYDQIIKDWVVNLPDEAPVKFRVATEKLVRKLAIELYLSSISVELKPPPPTEEDSPITEGSSSLAAAFPLSFRIRNRGKSKQQAVDVEKDDALAMQNSATYDARAIPPLSSQPSASLSTLKPTPTFLSQRSPTATASDVWEEDPASVRLRAFTTLTPQPALPKTMRKILSDWTLSGDPSEYHWEPSSHPGASDEDDDVDNPTVSSTSRARQRRHERRQRAKEMQRQQPDHAQLQSQLQQASMSQVPPILASRPWGSQQIGSTSVPTQIVSGAASSEMTTGVENGSQLTMTQIERGVFGSRMAAALTVTEQRKRKRRAAGF